MAALPGTQIYIRNCRANYKSVRTSAFDFACPWGNRSHIGIREFKEINWRPVRARFEQNVTTQTQNKLASANQYKIKTSSSSNKFLYSTTVTEKVAISLSSF